MAPIPPWQARRTIVYGDLWDPLTNWLVLTLHIPMWGIMPQPQPWVVGCAHNHNSPQCWCVNSNISAGAGDHDKNQYARGPRDNVCKWTSPLFLLVVVFCWPQRPLKLVQICTQSMDSYQETEYPWSLTFYIIYNRYFRLVPSTLKLREYLPHEALFLHTSKITKSHKYWRGSPL